MSRLHGFRLERREQGPPLSCVNERTCGVKSIIGFEVQHTGTNYYYTMCVDCARTMAERDDMLNPNEFTEAITTIENTEGGAR